MFYRAPLLFPLAAALVLGGCYALGHGPVPPAQKVIIRETIYPMPGALEPTPVINSNSPEIVQSEGILVSTLPPGLFGPQGAFLNRPISGPFSVFSHHIAKDQAPGDRLLYLGLLAHNQSDKPITLQLLSGASFLSQPDAPFMPLAPLETDASGVVFAGPGDRVTTALLHGQSPLPPQTFIIQPGVTQLITSLDIPTNVYPPYINGRSTLLRFTSDGPLYLSEVARFSKKTDVPFLPPTLDDYEQTLVQGVLAGPREATPTLFIPDAPPPKGVFRYGRVAGVSLGDRWNGTLFSDPSGPALPEKGDRVGFALDTVYLHQLGTWQNQSAPMLARYEDTALLAHGNYGVTYALRLALSNPGSSDRAFALRLTNPLQVIGKGVATGIVTLNPPGPAVTFRGTVRVTWTAESGALQESYIHLVLHQGEEPAPFATVLLPARTHKEVKVTLIYPPDATPPQVLEIQGS